MSGLSTKTSHGRKRTNAGIKLIAVAAVLMMVASGLCVMERSNGSVSAANNGAEHSIIYHSNNEAEKTKSVLYNGIAATEYNPEYWNFDEKWTGDEGTYNKLSTSITLSDKFKSNNYGVSSNSTGLTIDSTRWNSSGGISETYTLTVWYSVSGYSANKVFAGWNTAADGTGTSYYPGDVVSSTVTDLYAVWAQPDIFLTSTNTDSKSITFSLVPYYKTSSLPTSAPTKVYSPSPSMYTTIFALTDDVTVSSTTNLIPGTYRSYSVYESSSSKVSITLASRAILSGNAVFDNVYLSENYPGGNHGDGTSCGLFANGHVLILGTGIDSKATSISSLPQVFGGGTSDITTAVVNGKSIVSRNLHTFTANLGTMVIVHSGKYYNIVGGGASSVGSNNTPLSTYIVVKEASVYDTIVGGGSGSNEVYGASRSSSSATAEQGGSNEVYGASSSSSSATAEQGGSFIYAYNLYMPSDDWQSSKTGYDSSGYSITESSILEGGASSGNLYGSTHVFLTGTSSVWDAQAGGRRGSTYADFAYMEISGKAQVRHIACGTITDGNFGSGDRNCVKGTQMVTLDECKVAMLLGAGYDTYYYPTYKSMINGTINVEIKGGTVGYVYGGGYRGSVGASVQSGVTINIEVSGGTVVKDVFGGGRGGVDKVLHNTDGSISDYANSYYSMGKSEVYGKINVTVSGGTINGNVYGGGESVPKLSSVGGYYYRFSDDNKGVAAVYGDIEIDVTGGTINGDVYGGGKGILASNLTEDRTKSYVLTKAGEFTEIKWFEWTSSPEYNKGYGYLDFAQITGRIILTISDNGTVKGNVYGGGAYGQVSGSTTVTVSGTVGTESGGGNVYGGGQGTETTTDVGKVTAGTDVSISGTVYANVYGGGAYGQVSGATKVAITGAESKIAYVRGSVYGAGQGSLSGVSGIGAVGQVSSVTIDSYSEIKSSVYGGGAYGNVGSSTELLPVAISLNATVTGNVYGGGSGDGTKSGYGDIGGPATVDVSGIVEGNVYGGGAFGVVNGTTSVSVTGTVGGDVYGGGYGTKGEISNQGATVTVTGGEVVGSVYGGACNGISNGDTSVTLEKSATVGKTVYGGGLGYVGVISVTGTSKVGATSSIIDGSVYGGAENGVVGTSTSATLTSSVTLDTTTVGVSVFGGGVGELDKVSVNGKASVTINGATEVTGDVYGGAAYGYVSYSEVSIENGTIMGDVYGAGLGAASKCSVTYNVTVTMSEGTVKGIVYGGAAYGLVQGEITVTLSGGTVEGTVYAGGKGTSGAVSVNGNRKIHLYGARINGSLYGGSALGTDAKENQDEKDSNAYVYLESGYVKGSVFGGGFQGLTYGSTYISIGKYAQNTSLPYAPTVAFDPATEGKAEITIGESVYLGGDVGVVEAGQTAYKETMVYNRNPCQMSIDGTTEGEETVTISLGGSLMGSGNSCKTEGDTYVHILGFKPVSGIESVHRVTYLTIENSTLSMSGRATVDENSSMHIMDSMYSLYKIGKLVYQEDGTPEKTGGLVLKNGSTVTLNASMENVVAYSSLNANGDATQKYTPLNKIVIGGGNVLSFRQIETLDTGDRITYSTVTGYTIVTVNGEDGTDFGGYILGSTDSTGGFMVYHEGSFKAANYYDSDKTRCWYLAGTITQEVTVTVSGKESVNSAEAIVSLPRLQTGTDYMYTGGTYISGAPLNGYVMIDPTETIGYEETQFSVLFGYNKDSVSDLVTFGDNGTYLADYTEGKDPVLGTGDAMNSIMYVKVTGGFESADYVGYVLIYINECRAVTYSGVTTYIVTNTVQIKINIYSSVGSAESKVELSIGTIDGNGTGKLLIESGHPGSEVSVLKVTPDSKNVSGNVTKLYLESSKNADNTLGWTDSKGEIPYYINGTITTGAVGTLQGGYQSTLLFSVRDFGGTEEEKYAVELQIGTDKRTVIVHIKPVPDVNVTFNDIEQGDSTLSLTYSFHYGITISEEDCPPGGDSFVGWYTDKNYNNPFSYSTPLTQNLNLYALYRWTVTFDHMDGTTSSLNVIKGNPIGAVAEPVRDGYDFIGWFDSTSFATKWDLATQKVTSDMTLYAYWVGKTVTVTFSYPDSAGTGKTGLADVTGTMAFGDKFEVKITIKTEKKYLLDVAQEKLTDALEDEGRNSKFIYWVYEKQYDTSADDKSYAVYKTSYLNDWKMVTKDPETGTYSVTLCANLSNVAINILMDPKIYGEDGTTSMDLNAVIDPPSEFLAFPDSDTGVFTIQLNGAIRPGYNLTGWSLKSLVYNNKEIPLDVDRFIKGKDYLFLAGGDITVTVAYLATGDAYYDTYQYTATFALGSTKEEVMSVRLTGDEYDLIYPSESATVTDQLTFKFKSQWDHIPYTVTIADMENGTIKAFYEDDGKYVYFTTGTFYYGQKFNLIYSANDGYQFSKWKSSGEGVFESITSDQTTYVVQSDGVISAYAVGPQIVTLVIETHSTADWTDKGDETKIDRTKVPVKLALTGGTTTGSYLTAQYGTYIKNSDGTYTYTVTFSGTVNLGQYDIALCGTDGTLYDLGFKVKSTTKTNVYYITTSGEWDHVYKGKVIYIENAIEDKENGLKSYTEFLRQYTVDDERFNETSVDLTLNSGYFVYKDADGQIIMKSTDSEATYTWTGVEEAKKLEGEISHTKHELTINYVYGTEKTPLHTESGSVGYGELYWDVLGKLPTEITRTEFGVDVKYSVTSWVIVDSSSTDYINSSTVCKKTTFKDGITITANLVKQGTTYIQLHVMLQPTEGDDISGYTEGAESAVSEKLPNGLRIYGTQTEYQMLIYDGFDCVNVKMKVGDEGDLVSDSLKHAGLITFDWKKYASGQNVYVYLDRYTVTIMLYEHEAGVEDKDKWFPVGESPYKIRYGGHLELPDMDDTTKRYGSWTTSGGNLSGTVRDGVYSVTLKDVTSNASEYYLSISYSDPTFSVTFITPYGIIQSNGTESQTNTMFNVELKSGAVITMDTNTYDLTANGVTYTVLVKKVNGYIFEGWDVVTESSYKVESDVTITAKWSVTAYTVNIYYGGWKDTTVTVKDITATVGSDAVSLDKAETSKTHPDIEGYTYKKLGTISNVNYGAWVTIAIEFDSMYSLDTEKLEKTNSGVTYTKGSDLQHYTVSMFVNGNSDVEIYLTSMYSGATIFWNITYTDEDGGAKTERVLSKEDAEIGEPYFQAWDFEKDSTVINGLLAKGYRIDGWYYEEKIGSDVKRTPLEVKQNTAGDWGYNIANVPNTNVYLFAYAKKVTVTGIDTYYDGKSHSVEVTVPDSEYEKDTISKVSVKYTDKDTGIITYDEITIKDVTEKKTYLYEITVTKTHTVCGSTDTKTTEQVVKGEVSVCIRPNVVYLVVDNSFAAKSDIPTTDDEYKKWIDEKKGTYTTIGLVGGEKIAVTGWTVKQGDAEVKISDYGVYDLIPTYSVTNADGTPNTTIKVKVINGFITVNKTGYSSIIA